MDKKISHNLFRVRNKYSREQMFAVLGDSNVVGNGVVDAEYSLSKESEIRALLVGFEAMTRVN